MLDFRKLILEYIKNRKENEFRNKLIISLMENFVQYKSSKYYILKGNICASINGVNIVFRRRSNIIDKYFLRTKFMKLSDSNKFYYTNIYKDSLKIVFNRDNLVIDIYNNEKFFDFKSRSYVSNKNLETLILYFLLIKIEEKETFC